jgi:anthranilate synthase component 1
MLRQLTEPEYKRRAADADRVAVFREFLADRESPVAALSRLEENEEAFLLESVSGGETRGRYSYLGLEPSSRVEGPDALRELKAQLGATRYAPAPELPSFQGGAVGYVAYDAVGLFEPRVKLVPEEGTPPMAFLVCDAFLVFDNVRDTVTIVVLADTSAEGAYAAAMRRIEAIYERMLSAASIARLMAGRTHAPKAAAPASGQFQSEMTRGEFTAIVAKCKEAIRVGEVIQIVPSQKFTVETGLSALSLYRALRMVNPSPYNFLMRVGGKALIGSSPEELVKLEGGRASTAPIAGTRPRGATPVEDAALERELKADEKENAEHVMLVDLGRNDLGRVCEAGSVKVDSFAHVERYSHVMHLVSHVESQLEEGTDAFDLLRATFPAGTLSGAPKVRAMQLIAELESSPRGVYGGAAGYFGYSGDMDFCIVIRTMALNGRTLSVRAGCGVVADSDPADEYQETLNKARAIFRAVELAGSLE